MATKPKGYKTQIVRSWTCPDKKVNYNTKRTAIRFANKALPELLFPYKCPYCRNWHLTHEEQNPRKPYSQTLYLGVVVIMDDGVWSSPTFPDQQFPTALAIKKAIRQYLREQEQTA